jgi:general secretion pathway protein D
LIDFARLTRSVALFLSALVLLALPTSLLAAQDASQSVALTSVRLVSETPTESHFALVFAPRAVPFGTANGAPNKPGLGFGLATRAPSASQPPGLKGLVRQITFEQRDVILLVHFEATGDATLSAVQTDPRTVEVTVTSGGPPIGTPDQYGAANAPPTYDLPEAFELVLLKYADVSEVAGLLSDGQTIKSNDVFIPNEPAFGSNSLTGNNYQPPSQMQAPGSNDDPLGQSVDQSIAIDRRLNAVLLKGTPERIAALKAIIAAIDIPLDSVVLQTQMVELNESGQKALGIDFANASGQIGVVNVSSGGFAPVGVTQGCGPDLTHCSGHVTSAQFQAALYAQIQRGNGRIVSTPRIAAQSGSTAKIITGDALPILTSIALSGVNGVSQQVQYVNVGVTLQIAPRVSGDGFVSSHVFVVVSSVTGFSQGYPTISQREAQTSATVRDGDSFVIGGLTQDENINTKTKVPLLGDLPLIGQAFRTDRYTKAKTELYIVVTPRIVHHVGSRTIPPNAPLYAPTTTTIVPVQAPPPPARVPEHR